MFNVNPKILAHISALNVNNFVVPEYILNKGNDGVNLFRRYCPHRMYPLANPGENVENIVCKFHGFEWSKNGEPLNNNKNIACGKAQIGKSGLIFNDFVEPDHRWVYDLANEKHLKFSHVTSGNSTGSWLWMMEIQADLLHIRKGSDAIHPELSEFTNLDEVEMDSGDGWIIQTCSTGWWLFIYPYTFIEWSRGCLSVNYTVPTNPNTEFGFGWITQFYYSPEIQIEKRNDFESLERVFKEDVKAIELQKGEYFPLANAINEYENHCVHFGKWYKENRVSNVQSR